PYFCFVSPPRRMCRVLRPRAPHFCGLNANVKNHSNNNNNATTTTTQIMSVVGQALRLTSCAWSAGLRSRCQQYTHALCIRQSMLFEVRKRSQPFTSTHGVCCHCLLIFSHPL
ncbi:unnamed protein product, partial [Ectocarpus sp. 12 AP-2014]